jgi:hypothetical protein
MINYFFFPDSYREIGTTLIKNSIEDLNKALLRKDKNETFYEALLQHVTDFWPILAKQVCWQHPCILQRA